MNEKVQFQVVARWAIWSCALAVLAVPLRRPRTPSRATPSPSRVALAISAALTAAGRMAPTGQPIAPTLVRCMASVLVWGAAAFSAVSAMAGTHETVPLFLNGSHPSQDGFVRLVNHSGQAGDVEISAVDDDGNEYVDQIRVEPWRALHFNSADLEDGNVRKGMRGIGSGVGDWRLTLSSDLDRLEVLAYVRYANGSLASVHDIVRRAGKWHLVPVFNPASNTNHVSRLRLIGGERVAGDDDVHMEDGGIVRIVGVDDLGQESEEVSLFLRFGQAATVTAQQLEGGDPSLTGALGDGRGKWSLYIFSDHPITVLNLMETAGRLTNLSTSNSMALYGPPSVETSFATLPKQMNPSDWALSLGEGRMTVKYPGAEGETYEIRSKESSAFTWPNWMPATKAPVANEPGYYTHEVSSFPSPGMYYVQMRSRNEMGFGPASRATTVEIGAASAVTTPALTPSFSRIITLDEEQDEPVGTAYANGGLYVLDRGIFPFSATVVDHKVFAYTPAGTRQPSLDYAVEVGVGQAGALTFGNDLFLVLMHVYADVVLAAYTTAGERNRAGGFRTGGIDGMGIVDWVAHAHDHVYAVDSGLAYALTPSGRYVEESSFDLDSENVDSRAGVYADGWLYIVDPSTYKVYAYLTNGDRVESRDFGLVDGNNDPVGIAYGEGSFFVLDGATARIFKYD